MEESSVSSSSRPEKRWASVALLPNNLNVVARVDRSQRKSPQTDNPGRISEAWILRHLTNPLILHMDELVRIFMIFMDNDQEKNIYSNT